MTPKNKILGLALFSEQSLFFAVEVISLRPFHDYLVSSFFHDGELSAVRVITGIATRIVCDNVINKIFLTGVSELMCFAGDEEEGVTRGHHRRSFFAS